MSNLVRHAEYELQRAGLFDKDADYGGEIAPHVLNLIKEFSEGEHSGGSAYLTIDLFTRLAKFKTLTPITSDPSEWMNVSEASGGHPMWQNTRMSSCFSQDGGKTYYDIDERLSWFERKILRKRKKVKKLV